MNSTQHCGIVAGTGTLAEQMILILYQLIFCYKNFKCIKKENSFSRESRFDIVVFREL